MPLSEEALARLREAVGNEAVQLDEVTREAYSRDLSTLGHLAFRSGRNDLGGYHPPDAVVRPTDVEQVRAVAKTLQDLRVPLVPWGAGSGVCGGSVASRGGVVLDLKGLDRVLEIDKRSLLVRVEAGVNGQLLEDTLQREGLTLGHFPSSITCSTVGGWVATRSAGQLSTRYGKIEDMVAGLEVVLPGGELIRTPTAPRAATGPDWNQLFTGSEGTLGIVVACTLRVHYLPPERLFRSYEFPSLEQALEAIREGLQRGARPAAVRLYDPLDTLMVARSGDAPPLPEPPQPLSALWPLSSFSPARLGELLRKALPDLGKRALLSQPALVNRLTRSIPGVGWLLLLTFEGEADLTRAEDGLLRRVCLKAGASEQGPAPAEHWWNNRLAVSFKQSGVYEMGGFVDTMEVATTWDRLLHLHETVRSALSPHALVMAHFSHAYPDGCSIYFTFVALQGEPGTTVERYRTVWREGLNAAISSGAVISHHHGVGELMGEALRLSHGELHQLFQRIKEAVDPHNILNPGKLGLR